MEFSDNNQLIQVATANSGRERRGYNQGFQVLAMLHFSSQVVCSQVFITSLLFKPYISIIHTWFKKKNNKLRAKAYNNLFCTSVGRQITGLVQDEDGGGWKERSKEKDKTSAKWVSQWLHLGGRIFGDFLFFFILLWISQNFLKCLYMTFVSRDENKKYSGKQRQSLPNRPTLFLPTGRMNHDW